ncbi:MAG TPA: hypothetical protein VNQ14_08725 [Woeseiaceae bacterium]|nr:hypothetical protein [Woeseiaceae bacterium]
MSGTFPIDCERGSLEVSLALSPTSPPLVQYLQVDGGRFPTEPLENLTDVVIAAVNSGQIPADFRTSMSNASLGAMLAGVHASYGDCQKARFIGGNGTESNRVELACDFGKLELVVEARDDVLTEVQFQSVPGRSCDAL